MGKGSGKNKQNLGKAPEQGVKAPDNGVKAPVGVTAPDNGVTAQEQIDKSPIEDNTQEQGGTQDESKDTSDTKQDNDGTTTPEIGEGTADDSDGKKLDSEQDKEVTGTEGDTPEVAEVKPVLDGMFKKVLMAKTHGELAGAKIGILEVVSNMVAQNPSIIDELEAFIKEHNETYMSLERCSVSLTYYNNPEATDAWNALAITLSLKVMGEEPIYDYHGFSSMFANNYSVIPQHIKDRVFSNHDA